MKYQVFTVSVVAALMLTACQPRNVTPYESATERFRIERVETDKGTILLHFDTVGNVRAVTVSKDGQIESKRLNP